MCGLSGYYISIEINMKAIFLGLLLAALQPSNAPTPVNGPATDTSYARHIREFMVSFPQDPSFSKDVTADRAYATDTAFIKYLKADTSFTADDEAEIRAVFAHPPVTLWTPTLFPGARLEPHDSIDAAFKVHTDMFHEWDAFHKKYGFALRTYSLPVFFHNNTRCLFSWSYRTGPEGGYDNYEVFAWKNGRWVQDRVLVHYMF